MATCSPRCREGGASAVTMELSRELQKLGHTVDVLFQDDFRDGKSFPPKLAELQFATNVAKHIYRHPGRYDVVSLRAPTGCIYGLSRRFYQDKAAPPYVVELAALEERRVYAIRQESRKGQGWDNKARNRLWHRLYHMPRFRLAVRTADHAVCATREAWSYLQLVYGLDCERVTYLPHGVDSRFIRPRKYPAFEAPKVLYVGTWLEQRGIQYIGEALSELVRHLPGIRFTIAGCVRGRDDILPSIPVPLRKQVDIIPLVPSEQMPEIYANHDIFLFPSFFEALPLVLLEAMAAGMPVITTETCGMMDAVRDEWNGLLVQVGNSDSIIRAVLRLSSSPAIRSYLGTNAQETARWFSWERIALKLTRVLERVVEEAGTRKPSLST